MIDSNDEGVRFGKRSSVPPLTFDPLLLCAAFLLLVLGPRSAILFALCFGLWLLARHMVVIILCIVFGGRVQSLDREISDRNRGSLST